MSSDETITPHVRHWNRASVTDRIAYDEGHGTRQIFEDASSRSLGAPDDKATISSAREDV